MTTGKQLRFIGAFIVAPFIFACVVVLVFFGKLWTRGSVERTTILFDGQDRSFSGHVLCTTQPDGRLAIMANDDDHDRVAALIDRNVQLSVERIGIHLGDAHGFTDNSGEIWASRNEDTYKITGRMPPNAGEIAAHQFEIETRCIQEVPDNRVPLFGGTP